MMPDEPKTEQDDAMPEKWPTARELPEPAPPAEKSKRWHRRQARLQRVRQSQKLQRVRVVPRDQRMREILGHPTGMAFRSSGSVEWPRDQFTERRLRDGTVRLEGDVETEKRQQSRAGAPPRTAPAPKTS